MEQGDPKRTRSVPTYAGFSLFCQIFRTRNLRLAASEAGIPVTTASHLLGALREFFDDPLFIKTRGGFSPTERAAELYPRVHDLVADMDRLTARNGFDLSKAKAVIRVACADNAPYMLFGTGLEVIAEKAPMLSVNFETLQKGFLERLERKELDYAVMPLEKELPGQFHCFSLGENRFRLLSRKGHPLAKALGEGTSAALPDSEILKYPFLDITVEKTVYGCQTLRELVFPGWASGHSILSSEYFLPFVQMLERTDALMVLPERTAESLELHYAIRVLPTEAQSAVNHPKLIWHELTHKNPLHQWFRSLVIESCRTKAQRQTSCAAAASTSAIA